MVEFCSPRNVVSFNYCFHHDIIFGVLNYHEIILLAVEAVDADGGSVSIHKITMGLWLIIYILEG